MFSNILNISEYDHDNMEYWIYIMITNIPILIMNIWNISEYGSPNMVVNHGTYHDPYWNIEY